MWELSTFKPNLAATPPENFDWTKVNFEFMAASPKIDGIRVANHPTLGPSTRTLKPVPNESIRKYLSDPRLRWLDGEVVVGDWDNPKAFNGTQSGVMSYGGTPNWTYRVFDHFESAQTCGWGIRFEDARRVIDDFNAEIPPEFRQVHLVDHVDLDNSEDMDIYEGSCLELGFEGIMLRHRGARYKFGRSTFNEQGLTKIKRFVDEEAIIIGYEPLLVNENEPTINGVGYQKRSSHKAGKIPDDTRVGAWKCRGISGPWVGVEFSCGSGLSDDNRKEMRANLDYYMGKPFSYKYQKHGSLLKPRMPIWKGLRYD